MQETNDVYAEGGEETGVKGARGRGCLTREHRHRRGTLIRLQRHTGSDQKDRLGAHNEKGEDERSTEANEEANGQMRITKS